MAELAPEEHVVAGLLKGVAPDLRQLINTRVQVMVRHLRYLSEREDPLWVAALGQGWTPAKLYVVCALNSFYQIILAPLSSPARDAFPNGLGSEIQIRHGSNVFGPASTAGMRRVMAAYRELTTGAGVGADALEANQADDLLAALVVDEVG